MVGIGWGFALLESGLASLEPTVRTCHGLTGIGIGASCWGTLVKSHYNVCANGALYVHHVFWREKMTRAIDMRLKGYPFFAQLAIAMERIDLIAPTIGEDRSVPTHETVQSACLLHDVHARAQVQVIGIGQDDIRCQVVF